MRVLLRSFIELIMGVLIFVGLSPALVGIAIIGFQVFVWLATETWPPIPLADAIQTSVSDLHIMDSSPFWAGLAKDLRYSLGEIPLSSCFLAAGLLISGFMAYLRFKFVDMLGKRLNELPDQRSGLLSWCTRCGGMGVSFQNRKLRSSDAALHLSQGGRRALPWKGHVNEMHGKGWEGSPAAYLGSFFGALGVIRLGFEKRPPCPR